MNHVNHFGCTTLLCYVYLHCCGSFLIKCFVVFFFFHVCLKLQDANAEFEDSELRTLRNKNCELVGMLLVGKKAPHYANKFAGGRHRILLAFGVLPHFFPTPNNFSHKENAFLPEGEKNLKDICDALRSVKAEKEVELKMLKRNEAFLIEFYEQRKMAAEE